MKIIIGDLWECKGFKVIPANLSLNRIGQAVMGRGIAQQAAVRFSGLRTLLGKHIEETNNVPRLHIFGQWEIICFPVKRKWLDKADMNLIRSGLRKLKDLADKLPTPIYLPMIGCGFGELEEGDIIPILEEYLDDRFVLVMRDFSVKEKYPKSFRASVRNDTSLGG